MESNNDEPNDNEKEHEGLREEFRLPCRRKDRKKFFRQVDEYLDWINTIEIPDGYFESGKVVSISEIPHRKDHIDHICF